MQSQSFTRAQMLSMFCTVSFSVACGLWCRLHGGTKETCPPPRNCGHGQNTGSWTSANQGYLTLYVGAGETTFQHLSGSCCSCWFVLEVYSRTTNQTRSTFTSRRNGHQIFKRLLSLGHLDSIQTVVALHQFAQKPLLLPLANDLLFQQMRRKSGLTGLGLPPRISRFLRAAEGPQENSAADEGRSQPGSRTPIDLIDRFNSLNTGITSPVSWAFSDR